MLDVRIKKTLPGFNLEVAFSTNHEILAILGPSGSGKTMTLRCIAGLTPPDEGYIESNGRVLMDSNRSLNLPPQQRRVGFVFQNYALFPHMTVSENVAFGINGLPKKQSDERVHGMLHKMHISDLAGRFPWQLSAGQQQRVALARALAPEPEVLLLDEPFSALDAQVKERLEYELLEIQHFYQGTMLYVTHDLAEAYKLCSKIAVYESGSILQLGCKKEVIESPASRTVASLTGVKNLFDGSISDIKGTDVWVRVPGLGKQLKIAARNAADLSKDQRVAVGIRREYVKLAAEEGENVIPGSVDRVIEKVTNTSCRFLIHEADGNRCYLEADLPKRTSLKLSEGEKCRLYLPPEYLFVTFPD